LRLWLPDECEAGQFVPQADAWLGEGVPQDGPPERTELTSWPEASHASHAKTAHNASTGVKTLKSSLYERLGGTDGIKAVAQAFEQRAGKEDRISQKFARTNFERLTKEFVDQPGQRRTMQLHRPEHEAVAHEHGCHQRRVRRARGHDPFDLADCRRQPRARLAFSARPRA
jgi:hypothetical protein